MSLCVEIIDADKVGHEGQFIASMYTTSVPAVGEQLILPQGTFFVTDRTWEIVIYNNIDAWRVNVFVSATDPNDGVFQK